jgi:predicted TPR repeat methyltransferase
MPQPAPHDLLQSALTHHRAGRLRPAEEVYRQILKDDPDHPEALHGVGLLAMQSSRPDLAAAYLARAAMLAPNVAVYHHNLGEAWMLAGDLNQAVACLRRAAALDPSRHESHAVLGVALAHLQRFNDAADSLDRAVRQGADQPEIHQHLANALLQLNRFPEAETHARRATDRAPASAESWQTLGEAIGHQNRPDDAIACFQKAAALKPDFALPHFSTGRAFADRGRPDEAIASFREALRLRPDFPEAMSHLGSVLLQRNPDEGIDVLRKAVQLRPTHVDTHVELARGLELVRRYDQAADVFETILKLLPDNPNVKFHVAALRGKGAPSAPPPELVAALFNRHADTFDHHLTENLHYRAPQLLHEAVRSALPPTASNLDVMDLGCGTGLCAPLFRPLAKSLTGIDLSHAMVAKARDRNLYDRLEVADAVAALRAAPCAYDLIVAGDVLCYIGDLTDVFRAAASALRPAGLFAFSVELDNSPPASTPGYRLHPTRRYSHADPYLRQSATAAGFQIQTFQPKVLRREGDKEVTGLIAVLTK